MSCTECEKLLALGEIGLAVEDHLRACPRCREFGQQLKANEMALRELRDEVLPAVRPAEIPRRRWGWIPAMAAALVIGLVLPQMGRFKPLPEPTPALVTMLTAPPSPQPQEPLKIKMLTPDPDVVIYWLIEPKEPRGQEPQGQEQ